MRESIIQSACIETLRDAGWLVNKIIQTTLNGWPDVQAHKGGVTLFIECKAPKKKSKPLQLFRHEQLAKQGFQVLVIDNEPDALNVLSLIK